MAEAPRTVAIQYALTRVLAEAATLPDATESILRGLCDALGWDWAAYWRLDADGERLRCVATWSASAVAASRFGAVSLAERFERGAGVPGETWRRERPLWVPDVQASPNFPRAAAAAEAGLRSAIGVPVRRGARVVGVMEFYSHALREPDGDLLLALTALGGLIDRTVERDEAVDALRESEARKAAMLDAALDAIVSIDAEGLVVEWNPAAERTFGIARATALGHSMADLLVPPAYRARHAARFAEHLATGTSTILGRRLELSALRADRAEFPIELTITRSDTPERTLFTAHIRDITERVRAERAQQFLLDAGEQLVASLDYHAALTRLAELATPAVADWCVVDLLDDGDDGDGAPRRLAIAHADPARVALAWEATRRYPPSADAPHGPANVVRTGRLEFVPELGAAALERMAADAEHRALLRDIGVTTYVTVPLVARGRALGALTLAMAESGRRFERADIALTGEIARRAALAIDNARLYHAEQSARALAEEAVRSREQFLSIAAHELRTPLTSVKMIGQLLRRRLRSAGADAGGVAEIAERLDDQVLRLETLVEDLLDVSRIQQGQLQLRHAPTDLALLARAALAVAEQAPERTPAHALALDAPAPVVGEWDAGRLEQVLTNLLSNAVKYSPDGGAITVRVARDGDTALLTVSDEGIGIAAAEAPLLFQPFARAEQTRDAVRGTGLGLFIARQLVERHGGEIAIDSAPGAGTTVRIRLPLRPPPERGD